MKERWEALPEPVREAYPWTGDALTLSSGHALHYLDLGSGEPIVMVHGNPTWSFYWRTLAAPLSDTHRIVVPDHLGSGLSDKPQDWSYRLQDHIDNLVELIEHLDLRGITMVVHDWGGPIGLGAALAVPDRIARLVIFNTSVFLEHVPLSIRMARWPGVGEVLVRGLNGFARAGLIRAIGDRGRMRGVVRQGYLAPYGSYHDRIAHLRFIRDIPVEADHPTHATIARLHEGVPETFAETPTMLIWGDRDFVFTPRFLEQWQQLMPHAEVHRFPDAAHWVVEDAHERILPLMRAFLQGGGGSQREPAPEGSPTATTGSPSTSETSAS